MIECKEQYNASAIKYRIRMQSTGNQGTISTKVARSIMQKYASSNSNFFQNFCSTSRVPSVRIYTLYRFKNGPLEPKQCKILQMTT